MESLFSWFDLSPVVNELGPSGETGMPVVEQLLLYSVVVAGVVLAEAVAMARAGQPISLDLDWRWVVVACLIALVVFPAVWREIGSVPDASLLVQAGLAAQGGVFWGVLVAGAEKGARS